LKNAGEQLVVSVRDDAKQFIFSISALTKYVVAGISWLLLEYLEPGSLTFSIAIGWLVLTFLLTWTRYRVWAVPALLPLIAIVPINFFNATYHIASDQLRLKYRSVEGSTYFEFPGRWSLPKRLSKDQTAGKLVEATTCDDRTVAMLPMLPYRPIQIEREALLTPFSFRRLPNLNIEGFEFKLQVSTGTRLGPDGQKTSMEFEFGFPSPGSATSIPVTLVFPRSVRCIVDNIPLLPVLEMLPWDANDTDSLIKAVRRSDRLREIYERDQIWSLATSRDLKINAADSNSYKALFDFIIYSIAFQSLQGNMFSEARAELGTKLCSIANSHTSTFSGPFSALPEQFLNLIVKELGQRYQIAYPTCYVPPQMMEAFQTLARDEDGITPSNATFKKCLDTASSIQKCLEGDDSAQPNKICRDPFLCDAAPRTYAFQEPLFTSYDGKYDDFVATKVGNTVAIRTLDPMSCPELRDVGEERQFILWWLTRANAITLEPAQCSSADWKRKIAESKTLIERTLSCANKFQLSDALKLHDVSSSSIDLLTTFRCGDPKIEAINVSSAFKGMIEFVDDLDAITDKIGGYEALVGDQAFVPLRDTLKLVNRLKMESCGLGSFRQCIDEHRVKGTLVQLIGQLVQPNASEFFAGDDVRKIVDRFVKLDNVAIDMVICDLLQDRDFARRASYTRDEFCDDHGLNRYRLIGSPELGKSLYRSEGNDDASRRTYSYRLNKTAKEFMIELPFGDRKYPP
jgi:hypothetical protein